MKKELYKPFKSTAKNKKYSVYVKDPSKKSGMKLIHFGQLPYKHFKDKLGHYSKLDHNDKDRRKKYYARHGKATSKDTARWWAHAILW